jgi:GT2 family glycosyltransferase
MSDLSGVDFVGLCNDDAYVEPDWLRHLVDAMEESPEIGAASPKMLFAARYEQVRLRTEPVPAPGGDPRMLGAAVSGVRVDGEDRWSKVGFAQGFHDLEWSRRGTFRWSDADAVMRVPLPSDSRPPTSRAVEVELELRAPGETEVEVTGSSGTERVTVGPAPRWVRTTVRQPGVDVVQNAGSAVRTDGYGFDLGFGEPDGPRFDEPRDVFAWCGGSVLLRSHYVADVGLFAPELFLYYEDTDLSWRGRSRGWRHRYVPGARVRHDHASSSVVGSASFFHHTERNRLVILVRNADRSLVEEQLVDYVGGTVEAARREVVSPLRRRQRPWPVVTWRRVRVLVGVARLAPRALRARRSIRRRARRPARAVQRELVD